jgi:hypothetical protein
MNDNIIFFLDIDGVLNSFSYEKKISNSDKSYIHYYSDIDEENLRCLIDLVEREKGKIVIHSSWRDSFSLEEFKSFFEHFGMNKSFIVGVTNPRVDKKDSIKEYVKHNKVNNFLILEDEEIVNKEDSLFSNLYIVDIDGLSNKNIDEIHERLFKM